MKILIAFNSNFSEIIFSTPLIRNLKINLDADIYCLIDRKNADGISENPYISGIYHENSYRAFFSLLSKNGIDLVLDLSRNWIYKIICLSRGIKIFWPPNQKLQHWFKVALKIEQLSSKHFSDQILELLKKLNIKKDLLGLDYFIPEKDEVEADWLPDAFRKSYILLSLHSTYISRRLPAKRLIELCDRINKPVVMVGDKKDYDLAETLETFFQKNQLEKSYEKGLLELNKKTVLLNLCGKLNRNQIASLMRNATYVFSHDSWIIPVASALKKEIFTIWGNTIPQFGKYPYQTKFWILQNNRLNCRPCSTKGFDKCPKKHLKCLNEIIFDFYIPD